jgi:hypothetical protein
MFGDFQNLVRYLSVNCKRQLRNHQGLNIYDVRRKCDKSEDKDGPVCWLRLDLMIFPADDKQLCYPEMGWIETYLNRPEIKKGEPSEAGSFQAYK